MLLEFSVNNFKSIKDTATLSMNVATRDKGNNTSIRDYKILLSSVLYGANATGKSNFLKSLSFMAGIVLNQNKVTQSTDKLKYFPYTLSSETENASSSFEAVFFINEIKYRYGFELDNEKVYSEWLFQDTKGREAKLFYRDIDENIFYINKTRFKEGVNLKTLDNHLFIWKCDQEGGEISSSILSWFNNLNIIDGSDKDAYVNFTLQQLDNKKFKNDIVSLLKIADFGIENIDKEEFPVNHKILDDFDFPDNIKEKMLSDSEKVKAVQIKTQHKKFGASLKDYDLVDFDLSVESMGTKQFFFISAPILDTLQKGKVLLIDEFGSSLHPMLTRHLVKIFNNKKINKKNAQLIFATHDTNMLDKSLLRRDQIWFTEKDYYGTTHLYSLAEYKNIRSSENFEKNYLQGKYGAIPFLGDLDF